MAKAKERILAVVVHDRAAFNRALDREETAICIEQPLYDEMKAIMMVSKGGQNVKAGSLIGGVVGFALGGFLGAGLMLASAAGGIIGAAMDKSKMYTVSLDVVRKRIMLTKAVGKNKYNSAKHEIIIL
nr:hypothetical protein [Oscillospiraceae bacterium]